MDRSMVVFLLVGVVNTLFGTTIMFVFSNVLHLGYWVSTVSNYVFGSILSYFLNKRFTFRSKKRAAFLKFALNISLCYLVGYGSSRLFARVVFAGYPLQTQDNIAMLLGMCAFVVLNYLGQRYFVFRKDEQS